ncbi:MAG: export transporter periplasmic protein LptC [Pseudomonadota bacterium]|jgi:lipopolysaccharide export system protein LptC
MNLQKLWLWLRHPDFRLYISLLICAGLSAWLAEKFRTDYERSQRQSYAVKHSADYFSLGYLRKDLNKLGQLKSTLAADKMVHYSDDGITHIDKPILTLYNSQSQIPPWTIRSISGILSADGQHLWLKGRVWIDRPAGLHNRAIHILTADLQVQPKISYAETSAWSKLSSPPHYTEGQGLEITFKKPLFIKFLSNVKSYYAPPAH